MGMPESISLSGLIAFESSAEIRQTNLSGALIPGFRPTSPVFKQTLLGSSFAKAPKSSFVGIGSINRSLNEGKKKTTGFNLDVALAGPGYFRVRGEDGVVRLKRTIQGNIDPNTMEYKTAEGDTVLGAGGDIVFPAGTVASEVIIGQDGAITAAGYPVETLDIVRPENEDLLKNGPRNTLETTEAAPNFLPITDDAGKLLTFVSQGVVEESGVQTPATMIDLMAIFRQFQSVNDFVKAEHKRQLDLIRKMTKPILA